jgi:uncharacterized heparinase superfamily protein
VETLNPQKFDFLPCLEKPKSYLGEGRFCFLNSEVDLGWPIGWKARNCSYLWRYNLHYFDYLQQPGFDRTTGFRLIQNWIKGHPVQENGVGWEPYPSSLRLVNWIKFCSQENDISKDIMNSIMLQAINLQNRLEYHLLGNHLWANGKALWFAGAFLGNGKIASLGRKIISDQLTEQFNRDGGHFELSPMYHSIVLEDLLDLINLCQASGQRLNKMLLPILRKNAEKSLAWLQTIIDEKGRIPLLNDSAHGIAPRYEEIGSYAQRVGITATGDQINELKVGPWLGQNLSGYLVLKKDRFRLIFDTAPLGPDYLPAHAHCDILSVLLDFEGKNIWTDTGVFEYEEGHCRQYSRSTAAHNTVVLDGLEQAEILRSFRMGRRGHPERFLLEDGMVKCSHTGFGIWKKGLGHTRTIKLVDDGFEIIDCVEGVGKHSYKAFFHLDSEAKIVSKENGYLVNEHLSINPWGTVHRLSTSQYYPEFGRAEERPCLVLEGEFSNSTSFGIRCTYSS